MERGGGFVSVHAADNAWPDWEEWEPLTAWLRTKRSQP